MNLWVHLCRFWRIGFIRGCMFTYDRRRASDCTRKSTRARRISSSRACFFNRSYTRSFRFFCSRQFIIGMLVLDTWQYFIYRYMHHNKFLYKHIHSQRHCLVVPYAFGSLDNNPL